MWTRSPDQDTKFSPRKLTAQVFCEKTLEISGFAAVNFRGEFSSPIRGGRLAIRKPWAFSLEASGASLPLGWRVPHQLSLELMPKAALFCPEWHPSDRLEVAQRDRVAAGLARGQKENLLLDVGRQHEQVHKLAQAGTADMAQTSKGGIVADRAITHQALEFERQGQESGQTWNVGR